MTYLSIRFRFRRFKQTLMKLKINIKDKRIIKAKFLNFRSIKMAANTTVTNATTKCSRNRVTVVKSQSMPVKPICTFWKTTITWTVLHAATARSQLAKRAPISTRTRKIHVSVRHALRITYLRISELQSQPGRLSFRSKRAHCLTAFSVRKDSLVASRSIVARMTIRFASNATRS